MNKYFRLLGDWGIPPDNSDMSLALHRLTGLYSHDYEPPVADASGELLTLISDESGTTAHVCSSLVILPFNPPRYQELELMLEALIAKHKLSNIHFTEILSRGRPLGNRLEEFLEEYIRIVGQIPMACLSISKARSALTAALGEHYSTEDLYLSLFWTNVASAADKLPAHSVLHMYREQENNLTTSACIREFGKLLRGIERVPALGRRNLYVCRHPHIFTKRALFFSSLADLVAYTTNKLQAKIDAGTKRQKLGQRYKTHLELVHRVFRNYSGLSSAELIELVARAGKSWERTQIRPR